MTKLCGTRVPETVHRALDPIHVRGLAAIRKPAKFIVVDVD